MTSYTNLIATSMKYSNLIPSCYYSARIADVQLPFKNHCHSELLPFIWEGITAGKPVQRVCHPDLIVTILLTKYRFNVYKQAFSPLTHTHTLANGIVGHQASLRLTLPTSIQCELCMPLAVPREHMLTQWHKENLCHFATWEWTNCVLGMFVHKCLLMCQIILFILT